MTTTTTTTPRRKALEELSDTALAKATRPLVRGMREAHPDDERHLQTWVEQFIGVNIPEEPVCAGHHAPFTLFAHQVLERPSLALWHGPRGSGKSFLSALDTHLWSRFHPGHETCILGGSLAQSEQIHR